jgi:hypothetical protein
VLPRASYLSVRAWARQTVFDAGVANLLAASRLKVQVFQEQSRIVHVPERFGESQGGVGVQVASGRRAAGRDVGPVRESGASWTLLRNLPKFAEAWASERAKFRALFRVLVFLKGFLNLDSFGKA